VNGDPTPERTDASLRVIGLTAAALAFGVAAALGVARVVCLHPAVGPAAPALGAAARFQHGPDQRTSIADDWAVLDRTTRERLETYGWVDRRTGVVRIPIERAMDRLAQGGKAAP